MHDISTRELPGRMEESHETIMDNNGPDWLREVLRETGLERFHSKLTDDLQLTKITHFEFVSEDDLLQVGLSKPAARRLLAAVKKRQSFVTSLKNKIVNKLILASGSSAKSGKGQQQQQQSSIESSSSHAAGDAEKNRPSSEFGRSLTCLINSQDIKIKEEIGNGVHGFVKKGEWTTPNGRVVEVALKILKKDVTSEPGASFNDFVKEISVMHQLNHPNIIKLYGAVLSSPMMMVTELAPFGNLRDRLRKEGGQTPISQLINFGVQIASGMQYLESRRFVHRDLAARNIFISHGKKILIGDLGLMRVIPSQDELYVMNERTKVPFPWCAPESLKYRQFSSSSDVYMFGVTLWEMFSFGREPWAGMNLNEILDKISSDTERLPRPEACPSMVYQTLMQCWNTSPASRPNFSTLYQYLSTSYPLEVRAAQQISDASKKRSLTNGLAGAARSNGLEPNLALNHDDADRGGDDADGDGRKRVLNCDLDDRILVIDGQPEKYWWKGQNLRTFEIGWFPLSATRWLAPKRPNKFISKPLKNSFIHTGHCGPDGRWGSPGRIDGMYLRHPLEPDDINNLRALRIDAAADPRARAGFVFKSKTRSKLSKLFGINEPSQSNMILSQTYQKLIDEPQASPNAGPLGQPAKSQSALVRKSQSDELAKKKLQQQQLPLASTKTKIDDEPPLISFDDDGLAPPSGRPAGKGTLGLPGAPGTNQISLIDMDTEFPAPANALSHARRASDTNLDMAADDNYHLSWAGSWNTGTFYGSSSNIYSNYYCPGDALAAPVSVAREELTRLNTDAAQAASDRYYSAVSQEHETASLKWAP